MKEALLVGKAFLGVIMVIAVLGLVAQALAPSLIPSCAEDTVLVGVGEFDQGRWTRYVCGPAVDDYCANQVWLDNEDVLCIGMGEGY